MRLTVDTSFNIDLTGSNAVGLVENIGSQSYQALYTQSLSDIRWIAASNEDLTSSIILAASASGEKRLAYLYPADSVVIPWSGSTQLWAIAVTPDATVPTASFQYVLTER